MITRDDVAYVARLGRVTLDDADLDRFVPPLQEIFSYVEQLNELATDDVEPTAHVLPLRNVAADDMAAPSLSNAAALQSAPESSDGCFHVPTVIE
jgi:aspartyl-tRNA(Asn)/glutamyl-tRNA(Gln) amidotransferase subunit C